MNPSAIARLNVGFSISKPTFPAHVYEAREPVPEEEENKVARRAAALLISRYHYELMEYANAERAIFMGRLFSVAGFCKYNLYEDSTSGLDFRYQIEPESGTMKWMVRYPLDTASAKTAPGRVCRNMTYYGTNAKTILDHNKMGGVWSIKELPFSEDDDMTVCRMHSVDHTVSVPDGRGGLKSVSYMYLYESYRQDENSDSPGISHDVKDSAIFLIFHSAAVLYIHGRTPLSNPLFNLRWLGEQRDNVQLIKSETTANGTVKYSPTEVFVNDILLNIINGNFTK